MSPSCEIDIILFIQDVQVDSSPGGGNEQPRQNQAGGETSQSDQSPVSTQSDITDLPDNPGLRAQAAISIEDSGVVEDEDEDDGSISVSFFFFFWSLMLTIKSLI